LQLRGNRGPAGVGEEHEVRLGGEETEDVVEAPADAPKGTVLEATGVQGYA
jgi:hypothetical protein